MEVNLEVFFGEVLAPSGHTGSPSSHGEPPGTYGELLGTYSLTFWDPFLSPIVLEFETFVDFEENHAYQYKHPSIFTCRIHQGRLGGIAKIDFGCCFFEGQFWKPF